MSPSRSRYAGDETRARSMTGRWEIRRGWWGYDDGDKEFGRQGMQAANNERERAAPAPLATHS